MFGLFSKACPVDPVTRQWIESRWNWLTKEFGPETVLGSPTLLPTASFFPDPYDASETAGRRMIDRVAGYMHVDPQSLDLQYFTNRHALHLVNDAGISFGVAAGTYHKGDTSFVIRIDRDTLHTPAKLIATLAHELAHVRLLGEGRIKSDAFDHELLTDLTALFFGFGIFLANHPAYWQASISTWPDTELPRPEYMTTQMYGYALAHRSRLRNELPVKWTRALRPAARTEFKQAVRFLQGTDHTRP